MLATYDRLIERTGREPARGSYRGPDRRRAAPRGVHDPASRRTLACFVGLGQVVVALLAQTGNWFELPRWPSEWVLASTAMAMLLAGLMYLARWRLVGDARAAWVGAAFVVYGVANAGVPGVLRSMADAQSKAATWADLIRPAAVVVVMVLLALAAMAPPIDATLGVPRLVAAVAIGGAGAFVLSLLSPAFGALLGPPIDTLSPAVSAAGQFAVGVLWLGLATVFVLRVRANSASAAWLVLLLVYLAEARFALALGISGHPGALLAGQVMRLLAAAAAVIGGTVEFHAAYYRQRASLLATEAELHNAHERQRREEERAHDLRGALLSIGGAAVTLEHYNETLSPAEQAELAAALGAELRRLSAIVDGAPQVSAAFCVDDALQPLLVCARTAGTDVTADVPEGLFIAGGRAAFVEVVQNLIDNARRHAPGAPAAVTARAEGDRVVITVSDSGPGVPEAEREAIFERARRGAASGGSGLGLHIAHRLVAELGGTIDVADTPGGGATFVIDLPGAHA